MSNDAGLAASHIQASAYAHQPPGVPTGHPGRDRTLLMKFEQADRL